MSALVLAGLAGCGQQQLGEPPASSPTRTETATPSPAPTETPTATPTPEPSMGQDVVVRQEPGKTFYWVLPGERRLSPSVFGTPDNPRFGADWLEQNVAMAEQTPPPTVPKLLQDLPSLVAAPEGPGRPSTTRSPTRN